MSDPSSPSSKDRGDPQDLESGNQPHYSKFHLPSDSYLNTRFHLVSGKGGVGKSTVS